MKIGTLTTGAAVVTTINLNYLPQFIYYIASTALTGLKVTVQGDGVMVDLDSAGLAAMSGARRFGGVTNSYLIPICQGLVPGKVVTLEFTNSAAQTPKIYAFSMNRAEVYFQTIQQTVLANSNQAIMDFAFIGIKSPAAGDIYNIEFADGTVQQFESTEFLAMCTLYQNETDAYVVDNVEQTIRSVSITPTTNRTIYILRMREIGDVIQPIN